MVNYFWAGHSQKQWLPALYKDTYKKFHLLLNHVPGSGSRDSVSNSHG
jgi:hypothetical protein